MKKKLIEIVNAYGAAEALSREKCAYGLALALVRLKKALREEADQELILKTASRELQILERGACTGTEQDCSQR